MPDNPILNREEFYEALQRFRLGLAQSAWKLIPHNEALRAELAAKDAEMAVANESTQF